MKDNYLLGKVEFVLLDYNSSDGLEEWSIQNLINYIDLGILNYYKTTKPIYYDRSHSRNMAFRLANGNIVCNLDADNYLGEKFAEYIIGLFSTHENIFCISTLLNKNVFGRVCVKKDDYIKVGGYNEAFNGYGFEDTDFFYRLRLLGLENKVFTNLEFYNAIDHSDEERLSTGFMYSNTKSIYLHYVSPHETDFMLLHNDYSMTEGTLLNNCELNYNIKSNQKNNLDYLVCKQNRIVIKDKLCRIDYSIGREFLYDALKGNENNILRHDNKDFHKLTNLKEYNKLFKILEDAYNYQCFESHILDGKTVNKDGFGRGLVTRNFDKKNKITLI